MLLVIMVSAAAAETAARLEWLNLGDHLYYDIWHQLAGVRYQPDNVIIVNIDDQMLREHQDEPLVFWSPYFAQAIDLLRRTGAKVIALDFLFTTSAEAWLNKIGSADSSLGRTYDLPLRSQLAAGKVVLAASVVTDNLGNREILLPLNEYLFALPGLTEDLGLTNFYQDDDGVLRRFIAALPDGDGKNLGLTLGPLLAERGGGEKAARLGGAPHFIGFAGPPGTIPRFPLRRLLGPGAGTDPELPRLKDKIIIIASEHAGMQDVHLTPYARRFLLQPARMMSGAEVHANIVETILTGRFPLPASASSRLFFLFAALLTGTVLFFRLSPVPGFGALLGLSAICLAPAYLMFLRDSLLPVAVVQAGLAMSYLLTLGIRLTGEEREKRRVRQIFGRYVSEAALQEILDSQGAAALGGTMRQVTVLFADIRNFTTISEQLLPAEVVEMLNAYFSRACEPVLRRGGMVDKFIGDAIMAVFGSPVPHQDHARRAVAAALEMLEEAEKFSQWLEQRFAGRSLPRFHIGVGLHTGEAVVGNIGSPKRLEFTAIGDTVNIASRLEGLTKETGWDLVASKSVIEAAGPDVAVGSKKEVFVKGRKQSVEVCEIIGIGKP